MAWPHVIQYREGDTLPAVVHGVGDIVDGVEAPYVWPDGTVATFTLSEWDEVAHEKGDAVLDAVGAVTADGEVRYTFTDEDAGTLDEVGGWFVGWFTVEIPDIGRVSFPTDHNLYVRRIPL